MMSATPTPSTTFSTPILSTASEAAAALSRICRYGRDSLIGQTTGS